MSGEIILYNSEDGRTQLRLEVADGAVWLSQAEMAELFRTTPQNITQHIRAIYASGELDRAATCKQDLQVQIEGERQVQRRVSLYRLEMILAVGYRVRSPRGMQFRRWATTVLQDYLVKGFALDDRKLKEPAGGWDYFDELLERIREIRASEKRFYQKVRDLFATAVDYDGADETARRFFQTIQNKLLWAVTGRTAAELIIERADPIRPRDGTSRRCRRYRGRRDTRPHWRSRLRPRSGILHLASLPRQSTLISIERHQVTTGDDLGLTTIIASSVDIINISFSPQNGTRISVNLRVDCHGFANPPL